VKHYNDNGILSTTHKYPAGVSELIELKHTLFHLPEYRIQRSHCEVI